MAMTTITNNTDKKQFYSYIPSHGVWLDPGESITIDGDMTTLLNSGGSNKTAADSYVAAVASDKVRDKPIPDKPRKGVYHTILGNGVQTEFILDVGFLISVDTRFALYDHVDKSMIPYSYVEMGVPNETSIRLVIEPPLAAQEADLYVFS